MKITKKSDVYYQRRKKDMKDTNKLPKDYSVRRSAHGYEVYGPSQYGRYTFLATRKTLREAIERAVHHSTEIRPWAMDRKALQQDEKERVWEEAVRIDSSDPGRVVVVAMVAKKLRLPLRKVQRLINEVITEMEEMQ